MYSFSKSQRGFTILELLMTVLVASILLGLAVPSFLETIRNNRLIAQNNEFIGSLNLARSEALKRSGSVSVCASADQLTCSGAANWTTGWIVFNDANANGTLEAADGANALLQAAGAAPTQFTLNATPAATGTFVRFGSSGMSASGALTFNLVRTGCVGVKARRIVVSVVGRVSTSKVACP